MKKFQLNIILSFLLIILSAQSILASILPISLNNRVEHSEQIVMAKAIAYESYWNEGKTRIYTAYTMEVSAYLKHESVETRFELILPGGEVDGELEIVTPNASIEIGKEYMLILKNAGAATKKSERIGIPTTVKQFELYAHIQGMLKYENGHFIDLTERNPIDEEVLMARVKNITGRIAKTPQGRTYSPRLRANSTSNNSDCSSDDCNSHTSRGRSASIQLKNVAGEIDPVFFTGSIEAAHELVIAGNGFGTTVGTIDFPNSDSGGQSTVSIDQATDISSWTNTEIRVKIPSKAGTGTVTVKNSAGSIVGSSTINISYAINALYSSFRSFDSKTRQNVKFTNRNDAGGYTIRLNTTTGFASSDAVVPFEKALDTWKCASGINWQLDKTGTTDGFANDGNCTISYEPNLPTGVLGIATSRYKASGNSSCSLFNTLWYLKEFDIQFTTNAAMGGFSWNFGTSSLQTNQYDFQTIALHELGHAHGLGHVIDEDEIMHYSISNGVMNRTVTTQAHAGCNFKIDVATEPICLTSHEPMTLMQLEDCPEISAERNTSARIKLSLEGYYDAGSNSLNTNLLNNNILPNNEPFNTGNNEVVSSFPANVVDWVLIELRDENNMQTVVAQKAVFLNRDGVLVDITGNELLVFDDLDDKNYYVAIFHKSHLPIISQAALPLSDNPSFYDFSTSSNTTMGENQQTQISGKYFMSCGDFDGNGIINNQDFNLWKQQAAGVNQYSAADADGNGLINNLDFNLWKSNGSKISVLNN